MITKTSPAQSTPMTAVDTSWLRMESSANCMMIGVVLTFERPLPLPAFRQLLEERFLRFRRFRQCAIKRGNRYYWEDDPQFDLDNHLHSIALPGDAGKAELQELFSDLNSAHLRPDKPLWQMHHIDNYKQGSALLVRIHHCIADGISLVRVLLSLTDDNAEAKVTPMRATQPAATANPAPPPRIRGWQQKLNTTLHSARFRGTRAWHTWEKVLQDPASLLRLGREAWKVGGECLSLGFQPADEPTRLKGSLCGRKQVAWADPLDLAEVKAVAGALGGTVNDVLTAAASGALRSFLVQSNSHIPSRGIHVAVPFNLRPLRQAVNTLGNQFGLILVHMPVASDCPMDRFAQVRSTMDRLKRSYQPQVSYGLLNIFGYGPDVLERRLLGFLSKKASAVMTNVPGPRKPVYLCGVKLEQPMFWVPQTGDIGIGLSIFSYHDTVQFGLISDKKLITDPEAVIAEFIRSFEALKEAALGTASKTAPKAKAASTKNAPVA